MRPAGQEEAKQSSDAQAKASTSLPAASHHPGSGEDWKGLQTQEDVLIDAGLLSPASDGDSHGSAPKPNRSAPKPAEMPAGPSITANSLSKAEQSLAGGLLDIGGPVLAATASSCGR